MPAVWLVSWQDRVRDASLNDADASEKIGKSVFVNRESCNEAFVPRAGVDSAALQRECKGPHCYGALELRPKFRAHVLQHLGPEEREQTTFWSRLLPYLDMYDVLYFFEVTRRAPLQAPDLVLQSCIGHQRGPSTSRRGSVVELVGGTAERLSRENPAAADIMADSHLAVRVPTLHARLLMRGDWASLALICGEHLEARCPWRCDFASLGVSPAAFPRVAVNQDGLELADAFQKDGSRPLFGRSTTEFFYVITDDYVDAKFKTLKPRTTYAITEDDVDIDLRSGSTWTSCSACCTLPCCVQRVFTNSHARGQAPVIPNACDLAPTMVIPEVLDLPANMDETPILEFLAMEVLDIPEVMTIPESPAVMTIPE